MLLHHTRIDDLESPLRKKKQKNMRFYFPRKLCGYFAEIEKVSLE